MGRAARGACLAQLALQLEANRLRRALQAQPSPLDQPLPPTRRSKLSSDGLVTTVPEAVEPAFRMPASRVSSCCSCTIGFLVLSVAELPPRRVPEPAVRAQPLLLYLSGLPQVFLRTQSARVPCTSCPFDTATQLPVNAL